MYKYNQEEKRMLEKRIKEIFGDEIFFSIEKGFIKLNVSEHETNKQFSLNLGKLTKNQYYGLLDFLIMLIDFYKIIEVKEGK